MEEAKQEHVDKVGELLKWVSEKSKSLAKRQLEPPAEQAGVETSLSEKEVLHVELSSKKDQIDEAVHVTHMFLAKHSDKISEEDKQQTERQLESLQEAYDRLCEETSDDLQQAQSMLAEEAVEKGYETVAGAIDLATGTIYPIFHAIRNGLIDYDTGMILLEAQVIVSGLILPETKQCLGMEEALRYQLIDGKIFNQLEELSNSAKLILSTLCGISDVHSAADANDHSTVSEISVIKVLEAQFATGGLRVPATGEKLSLEEAFQREFITAQLYFKLLERQKMCKELIDPITAEKVSLMELMQRVTVGKETGLRLLRVKQQEGGTITLKSGRQASVFRAVHEGLIDREVMIRLLGAQLFAGGLIDPQTGSRLTVDEALESGLIDHDTASGLLTHQVQTGGIISPATGSRLTMDEAVQCNLITSSSALLVLESQRVFMGLIWPDSGEIFSIDTSLQQGVVTNELAHRILNNRQKIAALYIPESSSVLTPEEASKLGVIDKRAAKILSTATMPDLMPGAKHLQSSHADISSWGSNSEVQMCVTSDTTDVETRCRNENSTLQQMEVQQKFISYLMMHSYMDAGSGRRLLLVNSDLNEKIKMVLEASGADVPSENWQEYLHIQDGSGLENHLEAKELSKDADILKNHTNFVTWGPHDTGEKQAVNALGEHCGTINSEALYWMPGVQQFPASEAGEFSYSQTMDSPGNHVTDTKELDEGKAIHAIETLDNLTDILEEPPFDGNLSAYPDLNESIKLTRQTGNVNSVESDSGNQLRKSAAIPKPDTQAVTTALETADLYLGDKLAITMSSAEQPAPETMHRFPMEQLFPASESLKLSPFPLDMDLQRDFGEDLNRMLGFDGPPGLQCGDNIGSSTEDSNDPFVICAEHANKTAQNWNAQQYMEASQVEESDDVGGRQSIAVPSVDKIADNAVQSSPLGQQLMTRMDEFISHALEPVAATREDLTCGENNIRTVETLEDIAFVDEMVNFVGAPDAERLSEEVKIDEAMKVEGDEQSFKDGKHIPAADEDTQEDTNLENQVSFPKFTETNLDSQIIQGSVEEMWDVIGPSVEEHLTVTNEILHLSPLETGSESEHCTDDSGGHEDGKYKVIRVIETLDDIADLEDKLEISGEPVTKSSSSKNDKPCSNEDYNEVAFGNGLSGFTGIVEGDSIHQYTDTTSALGDNFEYGMNKVITSVEGLEDIAENQEMPWFVGDIPGVRETLMLSPSGIEDITGVFEPSIQMAGGEVNFLGDEDFKPSNNESDQSHQMYHQDFGIMKGQEEKGKQVNIELMHEAIQSYGAFEQDASGGNLTMSDTMMINRCLDVRCTLQEEPSDCAVTLKNVEGIQRINGRNLYVLEEEDEENDGKITCFEAAGSGEWARSALIKQRKSEVEVGGIFDPVTGKRYRLEVALARGLLDEEMFVDILASQFQDGGILFEGSGENLTLSEAVAKGLLQSHVAIKVLDKLGLIGGFYNSGTGEIIEVADVAEQMINDDLLTKVLLSEKIVCGIIDPETNKLHSVHDAQRLGILNTCTALRLLEGQVVSGGIVDLKHQGRLSVAVTSKLCLVDEKTAEQLIKIEKAQNGGQVDEVTKLRALSYQLEMYGILDPQTKQPLSVTEAVNRGLVERGALLSILGKQVEAGGIIQHKSGLRLSVTNALRHSLINEDLADDLFELEAACQNIHASSAGKNLCSQEIAPSSKFPVEIEKNQKSNELVTEFENGKSAVQIESVGGKLLDDSLHKEINLYESEDNVDERQLTIVSYSDLARISKIDIDTGRRYMAVKPLQEVLNVKNVETMSKLNVVDVDLSNACSTRRKELNDQTLICAKEDKSTVQDFVTRSDDNHQINSSTSNFFIPGRNQDSFVTTAQSASATHIPEEDLPGKLDRLSAKSSYVEDSPQGDFFSYIRECTSDIELECEASKLAGKENVLSNEDGELNEVGKLTVETFIGGANIEELESNNCPSSTNVQGLMGTNGECNLEGDVEGGDPNVKLGLLDKAPLTGIFKERNQRIQNSGLGDCAEGFEQNVNMAMSVGNVLKAVCMKFSNAFKIRPKEDKENPNEDTVMNGNRQEKEAVKTLNDLVDLEGKAEFAYRVKEMSIVSGARGNEGETSDHGDQNSFGESEDLLCQEGIDEEMQDQNVEGGQKLEKPLGKTWDSFELEKKANLVSKEERLLPLENVLGFAIDEHESLENANFQRVIGVNVETGDNQEADHFSLMECNTEGGGGSAVPAVQDVVTCGDPPADVKKSGLVLDCLKREFLNEEFSELFGLKDDESLKMAALLAALKPEMMSAQVQEMLCALSEEQDTGSLRSQELVSSLTDEIFRYIKNKVPGSMEDGFLNRQVKEMLCERILLLLSTAETPQDVSQQTIEEGNMYQIIQMKANGNPVNHCGSSHGELESREGTDKVARCDSPSKDDWFNNDESGDTMNGMPKIKQDSPDSVMQSADVFDEMEPLEDTRDKGALEDPPDNIWIGNNEGVGELKEMLQVRLAGQCVSENENEEAQSDSLDQIDLLSNIQGNTYELTLNEFRVKDNKGDNEKGKTEILNGQNITEDKSERLVLRPPPSDKEEFPKGNVTNNVGDANKVNEREMQTNGQCTNQGTSEDSFAMDDIQEQSIFEDTPNSMWINNNKNEMKKVIEIVASGLNLNEDKNDDLLMQSHDASDEMKPLESTGEKATIKTEQHEDRETLEGDGQPCNSTQQCLQHMEKLQAHLTLVQKKKIQLENLQPVDSDLEILQEQLDYHNLLMCELEEAVTRDLRAAEKFLEDIHLDHDEPLLKNLETDCKDLQTSLGDVTDVCASGVKTLSSIIEMEQFKVKSTHREFLAALDRLSGRIQENAIILETFLCDNPGDLEALKSRVQQHKDLEKAFTDLKIQLDATTFEVQFFVSEHALDLSPQENRKLLKLLNSTQTSFKSAMEKLAAQLEVLNLQLQTRLEQDDQKAFEEKQGDCNKRLQEMCDLLLVTESKIIDYDSGMSTTGDGLADLQQHQVEHQALQREIQANATTLANVVSTTEEFLEKNGDKLQPEERSAMDKKLKDAKAKLSVLSDQVDSNLKNIDNAVTTALKQETEKAAAVEQLKENENKIQGLLGWLSSIGPETVQQNGNTIFVDGLKRVENEDTVNGNLPRELSETKGNETMESTTDGDLNYQYQKAKLHHQQVMSQQQSYIISTQSVQDFLKKQGSSISAEEREKLEQDLNELKVQYETVLAQSESRLKLVHTVQDELQKFSTDYSEFENWLHESEQQLGDLQSGATDVEIFVGKLQRQKSFSEDVISHKGDLRYITISGQRVLDAAKLCGKLDLGKDAKPCINTSATCALVQRQLEVASDCYKLLHSKCNTLGKNLKDVVDKYSQYQEISASLLPWLQVTEEAAKSQLAEAIAADPQNLQKQLEQVQALQDQMSGHQSVVENLRKTVDALISTDGDLLLNRDEIQDHLDDVVLRYESLSKSTNDRNEKLRMTLTRSLSVQDGLDEMLDWMEGVEKSLEDEKDMPLNSVAIQEAFSKNAALEQNIASRQSSISAIKEKANKFIATADMSRASALQAKVEELAKRFTSASGRQKERTTKLEKLRDKVERFEKTYQKIEQFVTKKSLSLPEIDGPGKDVTELSQHMQEINTELLDQSKDLNTLNQLAEELGGCATAKERTQVLNKVNTLSKNFQELEEAIKKKEEKLSCYQHQSDQFKALLMVFKKWVEGMNSRIPIIEPSLTTETLQGHLSKVQVILNEWSSNASLVEEVNQNGSALCHLINTLISPAHSRTIFKSGTQVANGGGAVSAVCDSKELITIKQDIADVNHQYEELGDLLKNKGSQLESMLAQRQQVQEEAHLVKEWLESMDKRTASWDTLPTETEAIKGQVEQHKAFETELNQKTGKVGQVKEKLTLLLEENTDAPEAGKWRQMLDYIDSKWQQVSQSAAERQQKLEESSSFLIQFETAEIQLSQWLVEKELMMNVLGPLSIDPHMLNNQKQQVQILLKEFESRKPQHEQLKTAADGILSRSDDPTPACGVVSDQLAAVMHKWDNLTGKLVDRSDLIDQAIVKSTRYQNLVRDLSGRLSALDIKLASQPSIGSQPEAVKSQLETASEIRSEVEQEEKSMQEAQTLCEEISSLVGEQYLKAELSRQLDNVLKPFQDLEERAGNRVHQLQSALANSEQFQQMFDDFQAWMGGQRREQDQRAPVSAKLECLQLLINEQAEFQKSLAQKAGSYEMILVEGEALLQNMQPGAEKTTLQGRLGTLRADWEELARQVEARQEKMRDCFQKAQKYRECVEHLLPWIQECEAKASRVQVCSDAAEIESSLASIRGLQTDVDKHRRVLESLNNAADSLIEVSQTDLDDIQNEKASVNQRVDLINEQLCLKISSLDEMAKCMKEFQNSLKDAKKQLDGAKQQLELHDALGPQAYSNKCLTNMNAQQKTLQALTLQVENVGRLAQRLAAGTSDGAGTSLILRQASTLQENYGSVSQQVRERCCFLETKLQGIGRFQNNIREMFSLFADLDDELDSMAPVGRHLSCLHVQKDGIREFIVRLQELTASIEGAKIEGRQLLESASSPDLLGLKRDLDALSKQCNKLLDRAMVRQEQVETNLARVEEFDSRCKTFSKLVAIAEQHEESQDSVGTETDIINQQLESFKVFQKEEIEPLQTLLQEVNRLGQGLIQSAAKNTNIQKLEHDLEEANTRWNTLTTKVAERAAKLQEALLHCGRFQDAFESLLSWLMDTEELVANQKPPSAEFKVVKAQIQEQKLLQHLLDDRKPTVEMIKREGEKIAGLADSMDREKTLNQLQGLSRRWNSLLAKAENRQRQLEAILVVAQQFHDTVEPLIEWLSAAEKKVANSEPIGTQTTRLQEQISQHKAMEDDVVSHGKQLHQAISVGQLLKNMSSRDDKDTLQGRLDSAQTRYIEIQDRCGRKAALIQQALSNAWIFGEEEVEVLNWLAEVQDRLNNAAIQDYDPEHLEKQHSEHLALHEDIMKRKQHVDQAIKNGLALLKQTTGDEVIIIQERLDGIKARYAEITTTSAKVLKTLEQALQLATKFQSAHEVLATWLEKVEAELTSYASEVLAGEQLAQAQERQKELRNETMEHRVSLDTVNEVSSALLELVPWRAREGLDKLVSDDNERYRLVSDTIAQKVEEIDAAIQRSQQFEQAADAEIAWITETEKKLKSLGDIRLEQDQTSAELQVQKAFSMDILRHKDTIDELVANGDQIMNSCTEEEKTSLQNKLDTLQKQYEVISQMNAERYLQLERAQSLVSQFCETYEELWPWLEETRVLITQLPTPAIEFEMLKQQQEELRQLRELIAEHKPHIDKMNKTGPQLLELSPREGLAIQQKYTAADALYSQVKEDVKRRATSLDEAISQSTQFHDKISPMLDALERIARRLRQPPSISAEVEKIREQISENKNVTMELEKLQPAFETLKQRGDDLIGRSEGTDKDFCAKAVQDQLDKMVFYWADIKARAEEQEAKLLDVMDLAEKFWCDHSALIVTIKDTQDLIRELEEPGIDPSVVKEQQEALETIKEEVDGLQEELEIVQNLGAELTSACGEPDKPVVKKNIDELNCTWDNLNKAWKDRIDRLDEAMQEAVQFQDALQAMFDWMDIAENKLNTMPPIGTDLETVKQQIAELKQFKTEAYQQQIEMERLNHQGGLLLKKVNEDDAKRVAQEPLHELKHLWVNLDGKIVNRQHKLEGALLALGQFQHALDELMTWLNHTEELLNEQKAVGGDPKAIEIAIAKHHVLQNDVLAHKSTVETVNKAGNDLLESSDGEEASSLQSKLESLNQRWKNVLEQTEQRQQQLNHYLIQAQGFQSEIENMQRWLVETERQLLASKPVGGLPETAREQLRVHLELCAAFKSKEETYKNLINRGHLNFEGADNSNVEQGINNLKERWESVEVKLNERKVKLEEALNLATEFHNSLQDFINWLTQAEQTLTLASSPSLILDTIMFQIDEHKVFANEVNSHREKIIELDKTGTHLKYFSQKQDVVLIKNLLISVQARWEKVVQRSVDRGRGLDDSRKRAKQFQEAWKKLMEWLEDSEKNLDSDLEIANDPDKVKMQLVNHKEFQKALGAKHSVYDTTVRTGRSLKEKTTLADDHQKLDDMLSELRDKWDTVCGKSVERQNKLEEALLFSGQFTDALQALIDWLYKIEPMLAEDQPVHGDIDLVMNLIDAHKVFQKELGKRTSGVQALKRSARELVEASRDDSSWVKVQMQELSTRWETVCALSVSKQARLEQALNQAEEFHSAVHVLLEWLAEAEQTLRFHGVLPDDDEALRGLIEQHKEFVRKLEEKMIELNLAVGMGEAILSICHPDSITTIKHWITIIRARFEEVTAWAKQHQLRLEAALADVIANQELLENLLGWLHGAETILTQRDQEPLPQEIEEVKTLIAEHQTFVEEMTRKQPDVDKVTKTYKRKAAEPTQITSQIPVIDKGRSRKRFPARALYSPATQTFESKNPHANLLVSKWQQVWLLALDRRRKLNDALDRLEELREFANFDFDVWRKRYMRWMNHKKSRVMDFFRRIDKDQDGKITRQEFIDGILSSKFPTSRLEMSAVADIFDRDGDGYIDYYEFVAALHPNKDAYKPLTDADKIEDEVTRQVAKCKCAKRFQVEQIGENKYRFGDSQQLRLVRILRSTVMVRVGGGWMALDEFLVKNDPCRVHHHGSKMLRSDSNSSITSQSPIAKGRTNVELREKFMLPETPGQSIAAFRSRGRRSRPSSRAASPNRSTSSASQSVSVPPATTSTPPKTPQHLIRNYDKPWLTNSKTSSPYKSPESPERRIPSPEVTPIQGSKLRPPGYLSGKSFHSGDDSNLSTPPSRGRSQVPVLESRKVPSRPTSRAGSKTGSRTSSRRGSDASDFDISDIQSVCSDVSETVPDTSRSGSRAGSRPSSAKPSKIPTPSRRSPAASKLSTASKR